MFQRVATVICHLSSIVCQLSSVFRLLSSVFCLLRPSTSVEDPLQINPFYAKQTQFPKGQMNIIPYNNNLS